MRDAPKPSWARGGALLTWAVSLTPSVHVTSHGGYASVRGISPMAGNITVIQPPGSIGSITIHYWSIKYMQNDVPHNPVQVVKISERTLCRTPLRSVYESRAVQ